MSPATTTSTTLLFIDTNILLDFYRQVGKESDPSVLNHIDQHHDRIITTRQAKAQAGTR